MHVARASQSHWWFLLGLVKLYKCTWIDNALATTSVMNKKFRKEAFAFLLILLFISRRLKQLDTEGRHGSAEQHATSRLCNPAFCDSCCHVSSLKLPIYYLDQHLSSSELLQSGRWLKHRWTRSLYFEVGVVLRHGQAFNTISVCMTWRSLPTDYYGWMHTWVYD